MKRIAIPSFFLALLVAGCGGKDSNHVDVPASDRATAVVITDSSQLIGGPKAEGRVGDLLLANTRVRFVISGVGPGGRTRGWFPVGGELIDADWVRPAGGTPSGDDRLQEMATRLGNFGVLWADKVEVASDGSDGRAAVVRVEGHDIPDPFLQSIAPMEPANVHAVTEYRLEPYATSLEIVTTVTDLSGAARNLVAGDVFELGDYATLWAPGKGEDPKVLVSATKLRYFAAYGGTTSYGYLAPGDTVSLLVPQDEVFVAQAARLELPAGGTASYSRRFVVGERGEVAAVLPEVTRLEGSTAPLGVLAGTVREQGTDSPVAGAKVELRDANGPYTMVVTGADGAFHAQVEPGSYDVVASAPDGRGQATGKVEIAAGTDAGTAAPLDLRVGVTGRFALQLVDDEGEPSPARVRIETSAGAEVGFVLSPDGSGGGALPPGDYRAVCSRGFEWELAEVPFTVEAGKTTTVHGELAHVVDTRGWVAIDSHTHTALSADSQLDPRQRVAQALADGVELVIATDHDLVWDLGPTVKEMGLGAGLATAPGCEVSPVPGHINGYPALAGLDNDTDGYWPVKWWSEDEDHAYAEHLWPTDIFAGIRAKLHAEIVQVNHPRSSTQGALNWVGYDARRGLSSVPSEKFDMNWDVIEICNAGCDGSPSSENGRSLADWYSFLNQGYPRGAVGVSDAHGDRNFLGHARTLVQVLDDDPAKLDLDEVWASLKAGRAVVLDGPFVTATVKDGGGEERGPGGLARVAGDTVHLHVTVQAPSWIATDRVRVVRNGKEVENVSITPTTPPNVLRFDGDIDVPAAGSGGGGGDAWYVVIAEGNASMRPVGSAPRTITNAIYVDRDGNGKFDAPGL